MQVEGLPLRALPPMSLVNLHEHICTTEMEALICWNWEHRAGSLLIAMDDTILNAATRT